jgi:Xaa-Pro aminopeptidase
MSLRKFGEFGINQSHTMVVTEDGAEAITKTEPRLTVLDPAAV